MGGIFRDNLCERDSGEPIFAARHQDASQGPLVSELLRRSVFFYYAPHIYYTTDPSVRKSVCNFQENGVRTRRAAIANHTASKFTTRSKFTMRSVFSTAGPRALGTPENFH